jgi:SCY1-like protein 1
MVYVNVKGSCTKHCAIVFGLLPQVLLNAFGRALKDSFPPARCAALRAMSATLQYYSPEEIACRALPALCPLCVDPLAGEEGAQR